MFVFQINLKPSAMKNELMAVIRLCSSWKDQRTWQSLIQRLTQRWRTWRI